MAVRSVVCGLEGVHPVYDAAAGSTAATDYLADFRDRFRIVVSKDTDEELVADLVGIDAPIANALRRILIAETPSVAIEHVFVFKNGSIIQDEVLAHRLGLVPLNVDPRMVEYMKPGEEATDMNTLVFRLTATGESPPRVDPGELLDSEADVTWHYTHVYSSQIKWEPQGTQAERFAVPAGPVHDDILLAKLAPGQTIDVELHAVKGIGKDHAKFSPVATATYRLLPRISLDTETPFVGAEAEALVAACPAHVFDIEELGAPGRAGAAAAAAAAAPTTRARVARPRDCTLCRECIRKPEWTKRVKLERVTDHFIFSVESTGALPARELFKEALRVLADKCRTVSEAVDAGRVVDELEVARLTVAAMTTNDDVLA